MVPQAVRKLPPRAMELSLDEQLTWMVSWYWVLALRPVRVVVVVWAVAVMVSLAVAFCGQ